MDWVQQYQLLSQREREEFARIVNRLLTTTFLVKGQEASRRDFYFVERNEPVIAGYLGLMGWSLVVDRTYGVVQAINRQGGSRLSLRMMESVLLLLLRLLYEERRKQLTITDEVVCRVQDLHDKALTLRIRERGVIEKKHLRDAFALFRRYSLVELIDEDITDPACRFKLFPSILFAVRAEGLQEIQDRLEAYGGGGEELEVADGDQAG
ncbi:hypothetical protein J2Z79_002506 [Symbiobacterium terraclitae]|jgi:hypothetical protein|uniref:DUF4194 domain-containing protein n=1 Tax=Symbiobacterium terraclitae TaxID=557451 RepID=A0ABS4JU79_9FIRM|nr:DUF4194 domain-containing protein [Symbiobacterium terraclitae]MBP2019089.1 hypothetical protein [Symbiobacterium terraclitae]